MQLCYPPKKVSPMIHAQLLFCFFLFLENNKKKDNEFIFRDLYPKRLQFFSTLFDVSKKNKNESYRWSKNCEMGGTWYAYADFIQALKSPTLSSRDSARINDTTGYNQPPCSQMRNVIAGDGVANIKVFQSFFFIKLNLNFPKKLSLKIKTLKGNLFLDILRI